MHLITFLIPENEKFLVDYLKVYYPILPAGANSSDTLKRELEVKQIERDVRLLDVDKFMCKRIALFNTISYELRHELDAFLYNDEFARLIGMPTIHKLVSPTSSLAPYLIAPPAYLYAWYTLQGYAVLNSNSISRKSSNPFQKIIDEGLNDNIDMALLLSEFKWRFGGWVWQASESGNFRYGRGLIAGNLASDVMCTEAIMSYMVDSFCRPVNEYNPHPMFSPPPKKVIKESVQFDVAFWTNFLGLKDTINKWLNHTQDYYSTPTVVAYGLFLSFVLFESIVSEGHEYTPITKTRIQKPLLSKVEVQQLNTVIPNLISELGITVSNNLKIATSVNMAVMPTLPVETMTRKSHNIISTFNTELSLRTFDPIKDFSYLSQSYQCNLKTPARGISWSEMVHYGIHRMGIYDVIRTGDEHGIKILLHILGDKMAIILAAMPQEDRLITLGTLMRLLNESSLPPSFMDVVKRAEKVLYSEDVKDSEPC